LHMRPNGKPETVQLQLGLYFNDTPPTRVPHALVLRSKLIDIPAGEKNFQVTASYELPADVQALSVYPHAHYLGKDMKVKATLPNKAERWLLHIKNWDFNWQDEYRYLTPQLLPAGTIISMHYTYDNSTSNPRNPNTPPKRVQYGQNSTDEMAELMIQVLPRSRDDLETLKRHNVQQALLEEIKVHEERLRIRPNDVQQHMQLGILFRRIGQAAKALEHFQSALKLDARSADAHHHLGDILAESSRFDEALPHFQAAHELGPDRLEFMDSLAQILARHPNAEKRDPVKAVALAQRAALLTQNQDPAVLETLAVAHAASGHFENSVAAAEAAINAAAAKGSTELAERIRTRLNAYRQSVSRRQESTAP
jgi:tetratricopeptide (TPR) repeat protein